MALTRCFPMGYQPGKPVIGWYALVRFGLLVCSVAVSQTAWAGNTETKHKTTLSISADEPGSFTTCPTITNTTLTAVTVCSGTPVDLLEVNTTALPPDGIAFVWYDAVQENPYKNMAGIHLGEVPPENGKGTLRNVGLPPNMGTTDKIYYVYMCLKPMPIDPTCMPFALITVTVKPYQVPKCVPFLITTTKSHRAGK